MEKNASIEKTIYIVSWRGTSSSDAYDPYAHSKTFRREFNNITDAINFLWSADYSFRYGDDPKYGLNWSIKVREERRLSDFELSQAMLIIKDLKINQRISDEERRIKKEKSKREKEYKIYLELKEKFEK